MRVWLREARGEAAGHSGKPSPDPAVHATSQTAIMMQDSCPQPDCCSAGNGHAAGGMPFASAAALLDREVTPTLDPMAVRAEGCAGWERRGEGGVSVKASAVQGWPGGAPISPATGFPLAVPSFPARLCCLQLCLPGAVSLAPHLFAASAQRPHLSPCAPSSALQPLRVCRGYKAGHRNPAETGEVMLVLSVAPRAGN